MTITIGFTTHSLLLMLVPVLELEVVFGYSVGGRAVCVLLQGPELLFAEQPVVEVAGFVHGGRTLE